MVLAILAVIGAWICPSCGSDADGYFCAECLLPEPPPGMAWVPADTITVDGITVEVPGFFVDSATVSWGDVLPWLNSTVTDLEDLGRVITGRYDENLQFLRYTPLTGDGTGSGLTVPGPCIDLPATSLTPAAASEYLASTGRRLPTAAELALAERHGLVSPPDVYDVMAVYGSMLESAMGSVLGRLSSQAMFAGYSTASERRTWEWSSSEPGSPGEPYRGGPAPCLIVMRPGQAGIADRTSGYFNITFRGAASSPPGNM
jgi:hypothetical protein